MSIEEIILDKVKKLPMSKREQVLKFLDSIAETDDDSSELVLADDEQQGITSLYCCAKMIFESLAHQCLHQ